MNFMLAFAIASIVLTLGMIIRTKVNFIAKMLVPTSVIAGGLGLIGMNIGLNKIVDFEMYMEIVNYLFTITFISIGLTAVQKDASKEEASVGKNVAKGSVGQGLTWNILYAVTPVVAILVLLAIGDIFDMNPLYGLLIPFAFAQGPGQASVFGTIMETEYGMTNAAQVGITFAAAGFLVCFFVGVPLVKYGIRKGLAMHMKNNEANDYLLRGFYKKEEDTSSIGKETVYAGNMDTMTFHFAMIGVCFILALGMAKLVALIPGIGSTFSGMLFIYGMLAGYGVRFILKKFQVDHLLDSTFQTKITGWSTDYLVVASFMAVPFGVVGAWLVPILGVVIAVTFITLLISIYFCQRIGGENDFERTVGLFGAGTGTVPSGIALLRMIDPSLRTTTAIELGMMNIPMALSSVTVFTVLGMASGTLHMGLGIALLLAPVPVYLIMMKLSKVWGEKTYTFRQKSEKKAYTVKTVIDK